MRASIMRIFLLIILTALFFINVSGQVSFSPVDSKLKTQKSNDLTELICSCPTMTVKFSLTRNVTILQQDNFVTVDSQAIQITPIKFTGYKVPINGQSLSNEKQLLDTYSNYELDYFKNELGVEVINSSNQWVISKSKGWFVWYFRVGSTPVQVEKQAIIQLFASTVIGDKILTVNAPILSDGDFNKAALIVNDMMEAIVTTKQ
jgi:hypothetical protein